MKLREIVGLIFYGLFCLGFSIWFARCSEASMQEEIAQANARAEELSSKLVVAMDENDKLLNENAKLRDTLGRANDAVDRALKLMNEAKDKHEERIDTIEHDADAVDWLKCELPAGVCDAFKDYYRN